MTGDTPASLLLAKPFVGEGEGTRSLHFDFSGIQSEMRCDEPDELIVPYTRTMMGFLLFKPQPAKIVMIGLGGGSLPKYCYAKLPHASIVVAEINPHVVALRERFCIPGNNDRFRVICEDGAVLVRTLHHCVDVLLVDGFDVNGQSTQLCTQQFYDDCYESLSAAGLIVINLLADDPYLARSIARIRNTFENTVVLDPEDGSNRVAFASRGVELALPYEQLCTRLQTLEQQHSLELRNTLHRIRYEQFRSGAALA